MIRLSKVIFTVGVLFSCFQTSAKEIDASFSPWDQVPLDVKRAVSSWNHKFKPFEMKAFSTEVKSLFTDLTKSAPQRTVADFNGDGIMDFAFIGESQNRQQLIAVMSGKQWKVFELDSWSNAKLKTDVLYYLARASGEIAENFKLKNKHEAIQIEAYLGEVRLFGLKNQKMIELTL